MSEPTDARQSARPRTPRSWWILLALVPLVGGIVLLVFACLEGEAGPNKYGANPKAIADVPGAYA